MPARSLGSCSRRLSDSRDLEGILTSQIVYWRAFFILFHHIDLGSKRNSELGPRVLHDAISAKYN